MQYALIQDAVVVNIIEADGAFAESIAHEWDAVVLANGAGIGWSWDGDKFLPPAAPEPLPELRYITVGAFFDRFGPLKWAILADTNSQVQAVIRDASVRTYIDLDNADLPAGLALLQAAGHAIDADAVIDAPVRPEERP